MPTIGVISVEKSYEYYTKMLTFWVSEPVQRLDGNSSKIRGLVNRIRTGWLAVESQIDKESDDMKRRFSEIAIRAYQDDAELASDEERAINADIFLAYTHARYFKNELTRLEAIEILLSYYRERKRAIVESRTTHEFEIDDEFYLNTRIPDALLFQWLNTDELPGELCKKYRHELIEEKMAYLATIPSNIYSPFISESFANWGFGSFRYLNTRREKEDYLFKLVVQRQIVTYMHSLMVLRLSDRIQEAVWRTHPEYFINVLGYNDIESILEHRDEITDFIHSSSVFHDIGKNHIAGIINIQHRKLFDCEFAIIKRHPEIGAQLLDQDADFAKYRDIILGHHKFYNGKGGYPASFDNTASSSRFISDLITVCDCIDAATDTFGRNYASAKDFIAVREEIIRDAGTRYNPDIAEILKDDMLAGRLSELTRDGRESVYFEVYSKFLQK